MSEQAKLQEYAKRLLADLMSEISEDHYCAGWMSGLEYDLWAIVACDRGPNYGMGDVSEKNIALLSQYCSDASGWMVWEQKVGPTFVPLFEWLDDYDKWKARNIRPFGSPEAKP